MNVRELMQANVSTVRTNTSVQEIARLLTDLHLKSIPVVDEDNRVIGIVSESDLFLKEKGIPFSAVKLPSLFERWVDPKQLKEIYESARHHTASDIMSTDVIMVDPDESIGQAALLMSRHNISALPVVKEGKLVGIIRNVDFIRLIAETE